MLSTMLFILNKVDSFLIPCPFKYLTALDCPGCGCQRSIIELFKGNFQESFQLYPPAIPFIFSLAIGISSYVFKWDSNSNWLKLLYVATGLIIMCNYGYKILTHQLH